LGKILLINDDLKNFIQMERLNEITEKDSTGRKAKMA